MVGADGDRRSRAARGLKAGGLGLNLTSAEPVFLLDPWWNPAVEAQAIVRADESLIRDIKREDLEWLLS